MGESSEVKRHAEGVSVPGLACCRRLLAAPPAWLRRGAVALVVLLFATGLTRIEAALWKLQGGVVWGDSFTYVTFARRLAHGSLYYLDGPVQQMIASAERPDRRYWEPIWNHAVRPDGRTVCSMAIGYPLLLAVALKAGGVWLLYHINLLLTIGFPLMLALVIWEGLGRNLYAGLTAAAAALLAPHLVPEAIRQFTYPWREPYFYMLVLGAAWALLRFHRTGRGAWLGLMALLSGMACSVKEVNAVYVLWFGVMLLTSRSFWRHPRVFRLSGACLLLFFLGLAPLLVQNAVGTGNPFMSVQLLRETSQYSLTQTGTGLSMGNVSNTMRWYVLMYARNPFFTGAVVLLPLLGALMALRTMAGRLLLGLGVVHFVVYSQWGHADFRQSYFFNVPYAFLFVHGPFSLLEWLTRRRFASQRWLLYAAQMAGLAALALSPLPGPWRFGHAQERHFRYSDGVRLARSIDEHVPADALLLVNRAVRDVLGTFSDRHITRISDLYGLRADRDVYPLLDPLIRAGQLYFLDNVDRDPHYGFRADRARIDRETLLARYRFEPVGTWSKDDYHLGMMVDKPEMTLSRVLPWEGSAHRRELPVPEHGAAFLFVNRRAAGTNLVVTLDGAEVPPPPDGGYFCPVADRPLGATAIVEWRTLDGSPAPPLDDLAFVGWNDTLDVDLGLDAIPADSPYLPDGLRDAQPHAPWRVFNGAFRLRLPMYVKPGTFCVLGMAAAGKDDQLEIVTPDGLIVTNSFIAGTAWLSVPEQTLGAESAPALTNAILTVRPLTQPSLKVTGVRLFPCRRTLTFAPSPGSRGLAWRGRVAPDLHGKYDQPWSMHLGSTVLDFGLAKHRPFARDNEVRHLHEIAPDGEPIQYVFKGCGVMDVRPVEVQESLELSMNKRTRFFISHGSFGPERDEQGDSFCWTRESLHVEVPLTPGAKGYRLKLDARDGHPEAPRVLEIEFGGKKTQIPMSPERRVYEWEAPAQEKDWGLATVEFRVPTWQPSQVLGVNDSRELGFRFYALDWRPVEADAAAK